MSCQELIGLVTEYLDDALSPEDRARFDAHIADCPGCATYLEQMRQTISVLGELREDAIPPDVQQEFTSRLRGWSDR